MAFKARLFKNIIAGIKQLTTVGIYAPIPGLGVPVDGPTGTGVKFGGKGQQYVNLLTGLYYTNTGTAASPVWTPMAGASTVVDSPEGLGAVGVAKMTYDFAVNGGAIGTITPAGPTLPAKAIILGGTIEVTTSLASAGPATISLGTSAGSSPSSLKAPTPVASWIAGFLSVAPVFTDETQVKLSAPGQLTLTVATTPLTAGKFNINVFYVVGA